jgi:hypothetical protein
MLLLQSIINGIALRRVVQASEPCARYRSVRWRPMGRGAAGGRAGPRTHGGLQGGVVAA